MSAPDADSALVQRLRDVHYRVQEKDPHAYVEQYMVSCACRHGSRVWLLRPGDDEPDWRCPSLRILDEWEAVQTDGPGA